KKVSFSSSIAAQRAPPTEGARQVAPSLASPTRRAMRLQLAVLPLPRHLQSVFSPAAFPKAAAKPSAMDRPACSRDSFVHGGNSPPEAHARQTPADVKASFSGGLCIS